MKKSLESLTFLWTISSSH